MCCGKTHFRRTCATARYTRQYQHTHHLNFQILVSLKSLIYLLGHSQFDRSSSSCLLSRSRNRCVYYTGSRVLFHHTRQYLHTLFHYQENLIKLTKILTQKYLFVKLDSYFALACERPNSVGTVCVWVTAITINGLISLGHIDHKITAKNSTLVDIIALFFSV